ncbi:RHS repeat-associated core domain-containing protein [Streptomyces sp. NPDC008150]|uniref:RHS repeat domain-containing protein n=1 Tax=Streptomyces sp. NPDC008150 TaxID=3364816 RepID=UPI0036E879AF
MAVLCLALTGSLAAAVPAAAGTAPHGLGAPALPAGHNDPTTAVTSPGAAAQRAVVAHAAANDRARAAAARAQQHAAWPVGGTASGALPAAARSLRVTAGGVPVTVVPARDGAAGRLDVRTLDRARTKATGVDGVVLSVSSERAGKAGVEVGYAAFASAYGGGWAGRLRLAELPSCALTTPAAAACRTLTPLATTNDTAAQTLTANVSLTAGTSSARVLAVTAAATDESPTGGGDYAATPLSPSATWAAGTSSGSFTWSYPMAVPPAATGPQPSLELGYDSGRVDGRTATTNNQGSQVGEGFDLSSDSYVERSYGSCDDDGQSGKNDLCWKYDNASLVLNGSASQLVKDDATGQWRLKDDDASTVTHSTGADNGDQGDSGNDGAGEYWTVTTGNGTKYVFGLDKLPGADTQRTDSVWTVPVYGDDSGEPGYAGGTAFSGRAEVQAWRWNLDYVVDPHGNAMSYWYNPETNYYAQNGATTATAAYTRGGTLDHILYGQRSDTLFSANASDKAQFTYAERCTASDCSSLTKDTASDWPDVPFDAICAKDATCHAHSPEFFTRKRLTGVETSAWNAAASPAGFAAVDSWTLAQQYEDPGDIGNSTDQSLVLHSIRHTGESGGTATLPPVTFTYQMRPNRVDGAEDDVLPLNRPRIQSVTSETGAITTVTLSQPECVRGSAMPAAEDDDTTSCYPVYWHVNGADEATLDWFSKYRVLDVLTADPTGHGETMSTSYTYSGPAWHHNDDPMTPVKERTWSDWRGYRTVTTLNGSAAGTQSRSTSVYLQGMDGDSRKDGTTRSVTVPGVSLAGLSVPAQTDSDQYAGFRREQVDYDGQSAVSATVDTPWSKATATQTSVTPHATAYYVRTASTDSSTHLTASDTWRTRTTSTTYDGYGMAVAVDDTGDTSYTGDEQCTRTWYARNTAAGLTSLVSRTRVTGRSCSTAESALSLPAGSTTRGDVLSDTATVYDNTTATAWTASQTPTLGEATWTGRASAYPAAVTGGERAPTSWQTLSTTTYDDATAKLGRALTLTDAAGDTTRTAYVPAAAGPVTRVQVTNPKSQISYTYLDYARGGTVKEYDANGRTTEAAFDPLGRVTSVWLPNESRGGGYDANYTYAYHVSNTEPTWTSSASLVAPGSYTTTFSIFDSLLRPLQTQSPSVNGGRQLTDTRYDSRGLAYETYTDVHDGTAPSGTYQRAESGRAPKQTDTVYDGAGRATTNTFFSYGQQRWSTTTTYTGDSTATTAAQGGSATRTLVDALGRTTEERTYSGSSPADVQYGAGLGAAFTSTRYTYTTDGKPLTVTGPDGAKWGYTYDLFGRQTSATDPDEGSTTTTWTSLDQTDTAKDANGTTLLYGYDTLGRRTDVWKTSRTDANKLDHWAYDTLAKGQLDSATSYSGTSAYTEKVTAYDSLYHATSTELDLPATDPLVTSGAVASTLTTKAYYNTDGTRQYVDDPAAGGLAAEHLTTHHDSLGLTTDVEGTSDYLLSAAYTDNGLPQQLTLGTSDAAGTPKAYVTDVYDEGTDALTQSTVTDQTHPYELQELNYGYDAAGNVTHLFDPTTLGGTGAADNQCFTYDGYRRLAEAWTPATADCSDSGRAAANLGGAAPYWTSYTYTAGGLRSTETDRTATTSTGSTYCYSTTQQHVLTAVLTTAGATCAGATPAYGYDSAGETTGRPHGTDTQTLTWNPQGRLDTLTEKNSSGTVKSTTSHVYDPDGTLIISRDSGGDTVLYLGDTEVHLKTGTTSYWARRTYTAGATTIAERSNRGGDTVTWFAGDAHGTATLAIDAATQQVTKRYLTVFGGARTGGTGAWPDDKGFLGKTADPDSGLTHVGAREYDPLTGRFLSVDPVLDTADPQSLNGYVYAADNPLAGFDPTGTDNWWADPTMNKPVKKGGTPISQSLANAQGFGDLCNKNNCSHYNPKAKPSYLAAAGKTLLTAAIGFGTNKHILAISGKNTVSGAIAIQNQKWETQQYLDASRQVRAAVIARLQELQESGQISNRALKRFGTISVAWDEKRKMIYWAAYQQNNKGRGASCAEDFCDTEAVRNGSAKEDLQYAETHNAAKDTEAEICVRCQQTRELEQFEASGARLAKDGRLALQQMARGGAGADGAEAEAEAEAQAEAMATAELDAEGEALGFAMGMEDE